ncbi:MAG: type I methionyl aminopeptidase [Planctomycetes bacterium GWF2_41_51]|nr:MAG: type I methionyl aminopeptidase [Planctomycetes bacterium GWF2_41_51]HBG27751.1 type I methionyl aminopeptidase [Phycisphaerales bacterium]
MAIILRSRREIEIMKKAGEIVADVLLKLKESAVAGQTTAQLNRIAEDMTAKAGAEALFKGVRNPYGYKPFPAAVCTSINQQVVHGIPSDNVILREGDILSVDFGVRIDGYCGDAALSVGIGQIDPRKQLLMDVTARMLDIAIENSKPGEKWSRIAKLMQEAAKSAGFSVVTEFVGHGIGTQMHEDPKVPNFVSRDLLSHDILLQEGMVMAVEPMVNMGTSQVITLKDGWTVATKDGKPSAHFEHTIAITKSGCEVLTLK